MKGVYETMKQTIKHMALLLALILGLSGCGFMPVDQEKDDAIVVAEFKGGTVLKGDAMMIYNEEVAYYRDAEGTTLDEANANMLKQSILDYLVREAIIVSKADELGFSTLTDDERTDITAETTAAFDEMLDYYAIYMEGDTDEAKKEAARQFLADQGQTLESVLQESFDGAWQEKLYDYITKDARPTEEEIRAAYDEMVAGDQEIYQESPYDFEYNVSVGEPVMWVPDGYRTVKHILLSFTDEQVEALDELDMQLEEVHYLLEEDEMGESDLTEEELRAEHDGHDHTDEEWAEILAGVDVDNLEEDMYDDLELGIDDEEDPYMNMTPEQLQAEATRLHAEIDKLKTEYSQTLHDRIAEVQNKIAAGEDFDDLMEEYGDDPGMQEEPAMTTGYYVAADSESWDVIFRDAAMALANIGDVSDPITTVNGIHIIKYIADVQGGPVAFEQARDDAEDLALYNAQEARAEEVMEQWVREADVKMYVSRMR